MSAADFSRCACQNCGGHIEFPNEAVGTVVPCPHCQESVALVMDDFLPASQHDPIAGLTPTQIAAAFQGHVPRTRVSFFYQLGLIIVTLTMIILPLVYFAFIGAAAWCVYFWATHGIGIFEHVNGRGMIAALLLYLAPLLSGIVVVFFMVKPLLARRPRAAQPLALNEAAEPVLFSLVRCICDSLGAPFPKRIDVDCQLNASASFRRGFLSFFGHDLVLTIGLPLVAGMTTKQIAGILAHEFGHFTQGFGMRLTYIIRSVNMWFARVAYERDAWDMTLEQWAAEAEDWRVMIVVNLARLAVWFSRLILKLLLFIGHAIGCFMLRQMEYDADSYEIKLAGSETFETAAKRIHVLGKALEFSYKSLGTGLKTSKRAPNDFPAFLMNHEAALSLEAKTQLEDAAGLGSTGLFHSHPSDGDRIRRARRAGEPGVFDLHAPATLLFSNFEVLAKQVTHLHYEDDLGIPLEKMTMVPVDPPATG